MASVISGNIFFMLSEAELKKVKRIIGRDKELFESFVVDQHEQLVCVCCDKVIIFRDRECLMKHIGRVGH